MYKIITDSASNLTEDIIKKYNIEIISYTYTVDNEAHKCFEEGVDDEIEGRLYYERMRAGADVKTSLLSPVDIEEVFEKYMKEGYEQGQLDFIADALMRVYSSNLGDAHMLEGILTMIASVPYEAISPKGQIMAMGLLSNKTLSVRDKAIQCFERWNSKKGLDYLKNISCSPKWLQNYVDKVVMYIERDGIE